MENPPFVEHFLMKKTHWFPWHVVCLLEGSPLKKELGPSYVYRFKRSARKVAPKTSTMMGFGSLYILIIHSSILNRWLLCFKDCELELRVATRFFFACVRIMPMWAIRNIPIPSIKYLLMHISVTMKRCSLIITKRYNPVLAHHPLSGINCIHVCFMVLKHHWNIWCAAPQKTTKSEHHIIWSSWFTHLSNYRYIYHTTQLALM